ncbi:hypothetical protein PIB30_043654 [Stylosanthes scabra]|uniref:Peroxin-13 n=1 Tax=Stylosanthes scabra TaxID=79078 RepID=A0ABU6YHH3_9FABA|nr:hypothetical protein [Stylosanthes scabra]
MEEAYSYDQGYTPWDRRPYQHHVPQHNTYESNGYGYAYYGYKDPLSPYPPSQTRIKEALRERKEIREAQKRINAKVTTLTLSVIRFITQFAKSLLETDGQLKALYGVLDKSKFKSYNGHLYKLHHKRSRVGALRKYLGPWLFQEKLVDSQNTGWTNQVWDSGKSAISEQFWRLISSVRVLRGLVYTIWNPGD